MAEVLLKTAVSRYNATSNKIPNLLMEVEKQLSGPPKPKPRSIYKTDVL